MRRSIAAWTLGVIVLLITGPVAVSPPASALPFDLGWGAPSPIGGPRDFRIFSPSVALGSDGSAVAVWVEDDGDGTPQRILASRFSPISGWELPIRLAEAGDWTVPGPAITAGPNGTAIAVWDSGDDVSASRFKPGAGWETPTVINDGAAPVWGGPRVAMDASGNAVAVWSQNSGGFWADRPRVHGNRFVPGIGWGAPTLIDSGGSPAASVLGLAMDASGRAIAVWHECCPNDLLYANRFVPSEGWEGPTVVPSGLVGDYSRIYSAGVAMGLDGSAFSVYRQYEGDGTRVRASRFLPGVGWGRASIIHPVDADGWSPRVAMDDNGDAIVLWVQLEGNSSSVYARRFTPTDGWGTSEVIDLGSGRTWSAELAMNADGSAIAIWQQGDEVYANQFALPGGWTGAIPLGSGEKGGLPRVAMDPSGRAIALWLRRADYQHDRVYARELTSADGWGSIATLDTGPRSPLVVSLAMNLKGNATAVWLEYKGRNDRFEVYANRFSPATGWGTESSIGVLTGDYRPFIAYSPYPPPLPAVAMDHVGNAVVVWPRDDAPTNGLWAATYDPFNGGWEDPEPIVPGAGRARSLRAAMDDDGNAIVAWTRWDGTRDQAYASRFVRGTGWGMAAAIDPSLDEYFLSDLAMDPDGNAIALLVNHEGEYSLPYPYASRFDPTTGWGTAQPLDSGELSDYDLRIAMDRSGNAIAVWNVASTPGAGLHYKRFEPNKGWGQSNLLADQAYSYDLAVGLDGSALVAWSQAVGSGEERILAKRYDPAVGWEAAQPIDAGPSDADVLMSVTVDPRGNALVMWRRWSDPAVTLYNRFVLGVGWGAARSIEGLGPQAVDGSGNVVSVWGEADRIYANRFIRGTGVPDLVITFPRADLTNSPTVAIAGTTNPGVEVSMNGEPVPVDFRGSFEETLALEDGVHTFDVVAQNADGKTKAAVVEITVDTKPPTLLLTSPSRGETTESSTITVAGRTEPGAYLVVNGVVVEVARNGSFASNLALSPGANDITVTSTDAAGNQAVASRAVHYRPVPGVPLWLVAVLAAAVVGLTVLRFAPPLYARMRGRRGAALQPRMPTRQWPVVSAGHPLRLITRERILVQLLDHSADREDREVAQELTQRGIATTAGVDLRHFAQYVRPLIREGLVREDTKRVKGMLQRRKVLTLTEEGRRRARDITERIQAVVVSVKDASGVRKATIQEVLGEGAPPGSLLDIVYEVTQTGIVDAGD